jgi:hypothetical protein
MNGWPDWAVLWPDRAWVIELKAERGSHREDQLPYYLRLAAAAHLGCRVDLTYVTGSLSKPAPSLSDGQRYSHLHLVQVLPLVESVWGSDHRDEVIAYVDAVRTVIENLTRLRPSEQRDALLGQQRQGSPTSPAEELAVPAESQGDSAFRTRARPPRNSRPQTVWSHSHVPPPSTGGSEASAPLARQTSRSFGTRRALASAHCLSTMRLVVFCLGSGRRRAPLGAPSRRKERSSDTSSGFLATRRFRSSRDAATGRGLDDPMVARPHVGPAGSARCQDILPVSDCLGGPDDGSSSVVRIRVTEVGSTSFSSSESPRPSSTGSPVSRLTAPAERARDLTRRISADSNPLLVTDLSRTKSYV